MLETIQAWNCLAWNITKGKYIIAQLYTKIWIFKYSVSSFTCIHTSVSHSLDTLR